MLYYRAVHFIQCFIRHIYFTLYKLLDCFTLISARQSVPQQVNCVSFLNASLGRSTLSTVRDSINTLLFSYQRFLTILCFTFHKDCPLHSMLQYGAWYTPLILFLGLICSTIVSFKVAVSQDFLAIFILIIQPIWAPDKQVKIVSLKNLFSWRYSNF